MKQFLLLLSIFAIGFFPIQERKTITIHTIGDSTMAPKDTIGNPERGWAMALPQYFDTLKVQVKNYARNGRSTKSFIDEGRWQTVMDNIKPGDYLFIQFGHNDEKIDKPAVYADPYGAYTNNLTRFVNGARSKGAFPVLMTPIVRRKFDEAEVLTFTHGEYPDAVRALADKLNVPIIDMEKKSRKAIQALGPEESKLLFVWFEPGEYPRFPNGKKDDTHLNSKGAEIISGLAIEGVKELNLPISSFLSDFQIEK
jgi:DNA sulfur modification protein DndE